MGYLGASEVSGICHSATFNKDKATAGNTEQLNFSVRKKPQRIPIATLRRIPIATLRWPLWLRC